MSYDIWQKSAIQYLLTKIKGLEVTEQEIVQAWTDTSPFLSFNIIYHSKWGDATSETALVIESDSDRGRTSDPLNEEGVIPIHNTFSYVAYYDGPYDPSFDELIFRVVYYSYDDQTDTYTKVSKSDWFQLGEYASSQVTLDPPYATGETDMYIGINFQLRVEESSIDFSQTMAALVKQYFKIREVSS